MMQYIDFINFIDNKKSPTYRTYRNLGILFLLVRMGWYAPGNSYQYYVTNTSQPWEESLELCRDYDSELASVGLRNFSILM